MNSRAGNWRRRGWITITTTWDTSPEYYGEIITTRTYEERLATLDNVRNAGMKVCCGGIVGMGETEQDRIGLLLQLANLPEHPESVPINRLVRVQGTPFADLDELDAFRLYPHHRGGPHSDAALPRAPVGGARGHE